MRSVCTLHQYDNQTKEDEMGRACSRLGKDEHLFKIMVRKPEGKRPLARSGCRWILKLNLKIGWEGMDCIHVAQVRSEAG
jgi:hypothetical protein